MTAANANGSAPARVWIPLGAGIFLCALAGSAIAVPELRPLHTLQALIYVAIVLLARANHASAYGAGITIAVTWNSLQLFITHLVLAGAGELWMLVRTGHVRRPDTLMVLLGWIGHLVLLIACIAAFRQLGPRKKEWWQFAAGGVSVLVYFGLIVATMLPR